MLLGFNMHDIDAPSNQLIQARKDKLNILIRPYNGGIVDDGPFHLSFEEI